MFNSAQTAFNQSKEVLLKNHSSAYIPTRLIIHREEKYTMFAVWLSSFTACLHLW
jgi:hypothetical protein